MPKTIVALSTPPGVAGIAVLRLSGENAFSISDAIFSGKVKISDAKSHTIHYGQIIHNERLIDTVTIAVFRSPNSYTGEDVAEISCHGGMIVAGEIIDACIECGAELAEAGEFTKRAFLNGKMDLSQVEAVADIIHSVSKKASQTAARQLVGNFKHRLDVIMENLKNIAGLLELELDFADEEIELIEKAKIKEKIKEVAEFCRNLHSSHKTAEILRNGYYVGIAGFPNSGKSTLFNTLLQKHRAIVSPIPGTTRDYIEESLFINDIHIRLVDTAGIRQSDDVIEVEGVQLVEQVLNQSDMVLVLNDITKGIEHSDELVKGIKEKYENREVLVVHNKIDLYQGDIPQGLELISAKGNIGIENLKDIIAKKAAFSFSTENDILVNSRQATLLRNAELSLSKAIEAIDSSYDNTIIAIDIRDAARSLGEISGRNWNEDVLNQIFSKFCIGK